MSKIKLKRYSHFLAECILNSKIDIKNEIENIILDLNIDFTKLSRPLFNELLRKAFQNNGWKLQYQINDDVGLSMKIAFLKRRIGVHTAFTHHSFLGGDLLKFQIASYSSNNVIDLGVFIVTTKNFQKYISKNYDQIWETSLTYEKVVEYLFQVRSVIQIPIYVLGIDI
ncbi:MAG: BglII/BstYI family type II restriction endonuclease [Promethearchaeota archaeon]